MKFLDPRTASEFDAAPIGHAVNIPLGQLSARTHELPPRSETIRVVGPAELAHTPGDWLTENGREAQVARDWRPGNSRRGRLWQPNAFLSTVLDQLPPGKALDLGCGSGRDAVAMAACGWSVLAADVLPSALERGRDLAARYLPADCTTNIEWLEADVERTLPDGEFDLILLARFLPKARMPELPGLLAAGGHLAVEAFTDVHQRRFDKPSSPDRVISRKELPELLPNLRMRHCSFAWREQGTHTARVWAQRAEAG